MAARRWLLYDSLLVPGGAESVTADIAQMLDVEAVVVADAREQVLQQWPSALRGRVRVLGRLSDNPGLRVLQTIRAFSRLEIPDGVDVVYSGCYAPAAVLGQSGGRRFYYCHTPPRFAFDLLDFYRARAGWVQRWPLEILTAWLRPRYRRWLSAMDHVWANSCNVAGRLADIAGVQAEVLHPPCDIERIQWLADDGYYLSTARLEPFKRVDVIIKAFLAMPEQRLVVASGGSDETHLRALAGSAPNIAFTGWCGSKQLADLVGRCRATIYVPRDEDFGLSPVESMAAGKPVIGVDEGGLRETILHGETGWLLPPDKLITSLKRTVAEAKLPDETMRSACQAQASRFSKEVFKTRLIQTLDGSL